MKNKKQIQLNRIKLESENLYREIEKQEIAASTLGLDSLADSLYDLKNGIYDIKRIASE